MPPGDSGLGSGKSSDLVGRQQSANNACSKKMAAQVPKVVSWRVDDFVSVLSLGFLSSHLERAEVARFMAENIQSFTIDGVEVPCDIKLSVGLRFTLPSSCLALRAKFFTPKTVGVMQHQHMDPKSGCFQMMPSVPIGLDPEAQGDSEHGNLREIVRSWIDSIVQERQFAEQITEANPYGTLQNRLLCAIQRYSLESKSPMVKKALTILAELYALTRHLCLTKESISNLARTGLVPQDQQWLTARMLGRQIKSMINELLVNDIRSLSESFAESLGHEPRQKWAPCVAAFLGICIYMEGLLAAINTFIATGQAPSSASWSDKEAVALRFEHFVWVFHQTYRTHNGDVTTVYNPLADESPTEFGDPDNAEIKLVSSLRELLREDPSIRELRAVVIDDSGNYSRQLAARFLLSFEDRKFIDEPSQDRPRL